MKAILILSLLSTLAVAQVGVCKPGANCKVNSLIATRAGVSAAGPVCSYGNNAAWSLSTGVSVASLGWTIGSTTASCTAANSVLSFSVNDAVVRAHSTSGAYQSGSNCNGGGGCFTAGPGTAPLPAFSFILDPNTGLYNTAADQLGVSVAGARSFNFTSTAGVLDGTSANAKLTLNDVTGSELNYSGTLFRLAGGSATLSGGGLSIASTRAPLTFASSTASTLQIDSNTGRGYWQNSATVATSPPFDFGGGMQPVLQKRTYVIDVGMVSAAAPTFQAPPRSSAGTVTVAVVDGAAANGALAGATPNLQNFRVSNNSAALGNISSLDSSSDWIDIGAGPRWCQRVALGNNPGAALSSIRAWVGMASALPGASNAPATHNVSFRFSTSAGDTAWQYCYGAGATTCATTGVIPQDNSAGLGAFDTLCIDCREGSACTWWVNGVAKARQTSGLPSSAMSPIYSVENIAAASRWLGAGSISVELN